MKVLAGTSGYNFDAWKGVFYPPEVPQKQWLAYYARQLPTVEINYTFYRTPTTAALTGWAGQVSPDFRFALKMSQRATHRGRLADVDSGTFFAGKVEVLGPQLGATLVQLPPFLRKDAARLKTFLAALPAHVRPAVEFRHASWFDDEVKEVLRECGAALCLADDGELDVPDWATTGWGYARLRREAYDDAALVDWAARLRAQPWSHAFVYFKHEDGAVGVKLAHRLLELCA